jgi:DNA polymerase delta subunit 2
MTGTTTTTTTRAYVQHTPQWQRFQTTLMAASHQVAAVSLQAKGQNKDNNKQAPPVEVHPYQRQYAHVYHQRYQQLAPLCWQAVQAAEDNNDNSSSKPRHVARILELPEGLEAFVVGTLVRESLPEHNKNNHDDSHKEDDLLVTSDSDCRASDALSLEDDSGRVALEMVDTTTSHLWPAGAVLAVRGTLGLDGVLMVTHVVPPRTTISTISTISTTTPTTTPNYLLIVSGLDCGHASVPSTTRDLLLSFVQGHLGQGGCPAPFVARVLVAGGLVAERSATTTTTKQALQEADAWVDQVVAAGVPVDVLPAASDPTTANWPQRPLHGSLLPRASQRAPGLFRRAPNPYQAAYQVVPPAHGAAPEDHPTTAVTVVATDGLNVRAQQRVTCAAGGTRRPTVLECMAQHVVGRHLCPVGPSIVPTAPHAHQDPMVLLGDAPHLYVTGGAPAFGTHRTPQGTRLVAVPSFGASGTAVLVDLNDPHLAVRLLRFVDEAP